jgi:hypothetical protein
LPPIEFVVIGTPISAQGSKAARRHWQQRVKDGAMNGASVAPSPFAGDVALRILYIFIDSPAADLDNIIKPLQDAMKGVAFEDDLQVVDLVASMRRKGASDAISMSSAAFWTAFGGGSDFVYVTVTPAQQIEALQ